MRFVWVVALAGCNQIYGLETTTVAPSCIDIPLQETFDVAGLDACGTGDPDPPSKAMRTDNRLALTPNAGAPNDAACRWPGFPFNDGAFVEIIEPLGDGGTYTQLSVHDGGRLIGGVKIVVDNGVRSVYVYDEADDQRAVLGYDAAQMRWFRIRPSGDHVRVETAPMGTEWTEIAEIPTTPPIAVRADLDAGTFRTVAAPGTALFDNFNVCPR